MDKFYKDSQEAVEAVQNLYDWSENFEYPTPVSVWFDMTGMSHIFELEGSVFYKFDVYEEALNKLGYIEQDLIGRALIAHAEYPQEVEHYVTRLENEAKYGQEEA